MKKALLGLVLAAGSIFAGPRVAIGFSFGGPAPLPVPVAYARPLCPGPGYIWTDGYYANRVWVPGYWRAPVRVVRPVLVPRYAARPIYYHDRYGRGYWR